jgi:leader peptidase (prepilin peptidase) / N-methyltransferase
VFDFPLEALLAALFGLLIGSFLNVCIYRMPRDLSVVHPRSFCPHCETMVAWYDNIPVLSYLLLGAKCRHCRAPISWRYPAVEVLTALLFFASFARLGANAQAIKLCVFSAMMVCLIFMDLEERILADEFTVGGTVAGWVLSLFVPLTPFLAHWLLPEGWKESYLSLGESLLGALLPSLVLWGVGELYYRFRGKEGLGFGDVKMIAAVGAFYGLNAALQTLILGSVAGSLIGILFVVVMRKDAATYELPFGSFLGIAALIPPFVFGEIGETMGRGIVVPW